MPNPNPKTEHLKATQWAKPYPNTRQTRALRVRLPLELADRYDALNPDERAELVKKALEQATKEVNS
jgi:hypothetical protein